MFNLHDFVLDTILKMIGNEADYNVQRYAVKYYESELLSDEDMISIQAKIEEKNTVVEEPIIEEQPIEEPIFEETIEEEITVEETTEQEGE